jgi:hypothetical protein
VAGPKVQIVTSESQADYKVFFVDSDSAQKNHNRTMQAAV